VTGRPTALQCPSCASPYGKESLDEAHGVLACSHCGALATMPGSEARGAATRPKVPMPASITLERGELGSTARWRWFTPLFVFLAFFCVVWNGFLVFWYAGVASSDDAPLIALLFPLTHVAVGVGLGYFTLAGFVNSTRLSANKRELVVRHGPLPWLGNRRVPAADVDQLYCKRKIHRGKNGSTSTSYELWMATKAQRSFKLVGLAHSDEQVLFLEQWVEEALGLADRPMAGELER
jgi:hypothetical protein